MRAGHSLVKRRDDEGEVTRGLLAEAHSDELDGCFDDGVERNTISTKTGRGGRSEDPRVPKRSRRWDRKSSDRGEAVLGDVEALDRPNRAER
ncbi:hypothetical protein MRX96_021303 [Rhipicephalus microplus]